MNTPENSSEQLLATVLKDFPLASQWEAICSQHISEKSRDSRMESSLLFWLVSTVMFIIWTVIGCNWAAGSIEGFAENFFACLVLLVVTATGGKVMHYMGETLFYNLSPKKQKKYLRSNKPALRDYLRRQNAVRSVAALLPEFSTADLTLLLSHPQFNTNVFKEVFESELQKRRDAQIVKNVNLRFNDNYVDVDFPEPQDVFGGAFTAAPFAAKS